MDESNFQALDINLVETLDDQEEKVTPQINEEFFKFSLVCRPALHIV